MTIRSQNPLVTADDSDDARNVDDQLDEVMQDREQAQAARALVNHSNNARIEPRTASDPPDLPKRG